MHEIDSLRGIAILAVIIFHWVAQPMAASFSKAQINLLELLSYGVDLFFVISGFLIGQILLKIGGNLSGVRAFYVRRILRIWPLYYLILTLTYLLVRGPFSKAPYWSFVFFIFNFWGGRGTAIHPALYPLWSIAVEEQFYAVGPILFYLLSNRKYLIYLLAAYIGVSPFLRLALMLNTKIGIWEFTPTRLDGICVGLALALLLSSKNTISFLSARIKKLESLTLALLAILIPLKAALPALIWLSFGMSFVALTFGCLLTLIYVRSISNQESRVLNFGLLRYLGVRCYSIYLFHMFFMIVSYLLFKNMTTQFFVQTVLTFGFAHISWRYIEAPFIQLGQKFSYADS